MQPAFLDQLECVKTVLCFWTLHLNLTRFNFLWKFTNFETTVHPVLQSNWIFCVAGHTMLVITTYFSDEWNDVLINSCWYLYNFYKKSSCCWEHISRRFGRSHTFLLSNCYMERNHINTDHLTLNLGLGCTSPTFPGSSRDIYGRQRNTLETHCKSTCALESLF